jgi:hypothetical protein
MKKKNISIHLFNRAEPDGLWPFIKSIALFLFLFSLLVNLSCEKQEKIEPKLKSKTNSPPVITSVNILPESPNRESELSVIIQSNDPDGDPVTYRYQWIKNYEVIAGEDKNTLKPGNLKKGDIIQIRVIPSDGKVEGKPFVSALVKILNAPPVVQEVWIEPKAPTVKDSLKAFEKSVDADGDSIYFTYQWEKNGVVLLDERKEILEQGRFKKGDTITVAIVPDDREVMGVPKKSAPITILNSAPAIDSSPPFSMDGTKYVYQIKASDPDNDPITFSLKSGPKGMKVDQKTGLIQWEIQKEDKGTHSIEIEVRDNEGATSYQRYTLVVEVR